MKKKFALALVLLSVMLLIVACGVETIEHKLLVQINGEGTVEPMAGQFKSGSKVVFNIQPKAGWGFSHWEGDHSAEVTKDDTGEEEAWCILMTGDKRVTAVFADLATYWELDIRIEGEGNVEPRSGRFKDGTRVNISVQPQTGWLFKDWEGKNRWDIEGSGSRWHLEMDENKKLVAIFERDKEYGLEVEVIGNGTVDQKILNNVTVRLTAMPATGWKFKEWRGDAYGTNPVFDIEFNNKKSVTAVFERDNFNLDVVVLGQGRVEEKLINDLDSSDYPYESSVRLTAIPNNGWIFKEWRGDASGTSEIIYVEMLGHKRVTAVFEEKQENYKLNVTITGKGRVEEKVTSDNDIEALDYPYMAKVRLWAYPESGWVFKEWRGDASGTEPVTTVTMTGNKDVTAVFEQRKYSLTINVIGEGTVEEKLVSGPDSSDYPYGSVVRLWAKPNDGWEFKEWRGDAKGDDVILLIEVDDDKKVTAVFEQRQYNLQIDIEGNGQVEEKLLKNSAHPIGSIVELRAIADNGWSFKEWRGDASGTESRVEITMDRDKSVKAIFVKGEESKFKLTIDITGEGQVKRSPDSDSYAPDTVVTLTALPASGWEFKEWRGDLSGTNEVAEVKMEFDRYIDAIFQRSSTGTSTLSGQVSMNHTWPAPYSASEGSLTKARNELAKLSDKVSLKSNFSLRSREIAKAGELVVGFRATSSEDEHLAILAMAGVEKQDCIPELNAYLVKTSESELRAKMDILTNNREVAYVEPNYKAYAFSQTRIPNDGFYNYQWHYKQIRLPQAWATTVGSSSIRVAVLDTGIDVKHPDIGNMVDTASGRNFIDNTTNTNDGQGHGTHVAGTIAANTNNNEGVAGIMWQASVIPVKVLNDQGEGDFFGVAKGILYAAGLDNANPLNNPAHIINLSLGGSSSSTVLEDAVKKAYNAGVVIVAAAGMDTGSQIGYPASYDEVIAVGGVNYNYPNAPVRCDYSSYGPQLDLVAPGGNNQEDTNDDKYADGVLSTAFEGSTYGYHFFSGTSMASAHVSGVVGLMLANGIPASQVRSVLHRTSMDLGDPGFDYYYGHGLVNAFWAVNDVKEITIAVGTKEGNTITTVAKGTIDLTSKSYSLSDIPAGEYQVFGWVDAQGNGVIDSGDYFFESPTMSFDGGSKSLNITLGER